MANEIPTTFTLMVPCQNTANFGDVMMYDPMTGAYMGSFPNGWGEFDSVYFQAPRGITGGLYQDQPAAFLMCHGYLDSTDPPGGLKLMYFLTAQAFEYGVLRWLNGADAYNGTLIYTSNGLCYSQGFLYLLAEGGPVLRYYADTGQPAGTPNNLTAATFIAPGAVASGISQGLAIAPESIGGNLFVASGSEILIFDPSNASQLGSIQFPGLSPNALAFDVNGILYVLDGSGNVLSFNGATGQPIGANGSNDDPTLVPLNTGGITPNGGLCVANWADGTAVYVTAQGAIEGAGGGVVAQFDGITGAFEKILVPNGSGGLNVPSSITLGLAEVPYPPPPQPPGPPFWRLPWPRWPILLRKP